MHAEPLRDAGYLLSDVAQTNDAEGLATELGQRTVPEAEVGAGAPPALAYLPRIVLSVVGYGQQVGKHHLRHAVRAVGRHVGDDDAPLAGCRYVDDVVARGQHADVFQPRQSLHFLTSQAHLVGQHDVGIEAARDGIGCSGAVVHRHVPQPFQFSPRQVAGVGSEGIKDNDIHLFIQIAFDGALGSLLKLVFRNLDVVDALVGRYQLIDVDSVQLHDVADVILCEP